MTVRTSQSCGYFFHGIDFNLLGLVQPSTPRTVKGEVSSKTKSFEFRRKFLARLHRSANFVFRRAAFFDTFKSMRMESDFHE